ncbi:uncharacterized protein Z520_06445 [Fonsecaea multimorphosa CBS 102226]|uniref:Uncharacterized protein n=1 Tax=Fonsecaea multimorphosa CBS 102226 TaxID=1442371 RepID=A0A0D2JW09_9EURO|nr:uncharacterized protein Z520_06445 [Fonsecaea multimorphosa CBS 102226]KIX97667.1 hypothetical protein Z520_06445 [Fonsecaea multimorphosa CBS 102226]OAL23985.1 hypothetical protein AYO22_06009 [Fonsecaea multimorphosa]
MPSTLRFRPPYRGEKDALVVPRTPKSPRGEYTGEPVPAEDSTSKRHPLKVVFSVLLFAGALSWSFFSYRHQLVIPAFPSAYWKTNSTAHTDHQLQTFTPSFGAAPSVFADRYEFQLQGSRGDRAWLRMFPKGDGRVSVRHPRKYGLPPSAAAVDGDGQAVSDTEIYDVAVVRQLECLAFIRQILIDYDHEQHPHVHEKAQVYHCLDHVRQALLCAADTTLEPTRDGGAFSPLNVNGPHHYVGHQKTVMSGSASALHTCKNWTAVRSWIEENRVAGTE